MRQPGGHGNLRFHPDCPVCRAERLAGTPPSDELVTGRVRAGFAAALLAATGVSGSPAFAGEPDGEREGAGEEAPGDADPDFDEGTQDEELPVDEGSEIPPAGDEGEVEQGPERESDPEQVKPDAPPPAPEEPATEVVAVPPPPAPPPPATMPPDSEKLEDRPEIPPDRSTDGPPPETLRLRALGPPPSEPRMRSPAPGPDAPAQPPAGQQQGAATTAPSAQSGPTSAANAEPAPQTQAPNTAGPPGDSRTHVVREGECLWSIAAAQIGPDATPAQVARLVNRLWELNVERIGTGDPDLLMVGTELRLP